MGLDNGLLIYPRKNGMKIPKRIAKEKITDDLFEIAYWRKYWPLRGDILCVLPKETEKIENFGSAYHVKTKAMLEEIYDIVKNAYKTPKNYRASNRDYWWFGYWHYFKFNIWVGIKYLRNIKWAIKHFDDLEAYFYDSY